MQITALLQLAGSIISDLGLDRPPTNKLITPKTCLADAWAAVSRGQPVPRPTHTNDERRALLGYYHVSSL